MIWIKRWLAVILALVSLTAYVVNLKADVDKKADAADVVEVNRKLDYLIEKVDGMDVRSRQFFCRDQPVWCR
jgi:hypothetical protein